MKDSERLFTTDEVAHIAQKAITSAVRGISTSLKADPDRAWSGANMARTLDRVLVDINGPYSPMLQAIIQSAVESEPYRD